MRSFLSRHRFEAMFAALLLLLAPGPSQGIAITWNLAGDGWWNVDTNWSPEQEPAHDDDVFLTSSDAIDTTVAYATSYPTAVLNSLTIDASGSGGMTLDHAAGPLSVSELRVGDAVSSDGSYDLSGSGSLSAGNEYIGYAGTGRFTQSGGTNQVTNDLHLGFYSGSDGAYILSGGTLDVGGNIVGGSVTSTFEANGGTLILGGGTSGSIGVRVFAVAYPLGSSGSFVLNAGQSLSVGSEYVGYAGTGSFTQSGGTNLLSHLHVGSNATGTGSYELGAGSLSANNEYIGEHGTGSFTQSGGTNAVTNDLHVGTNVGAVGSYELNAGSLSAATEHIGLAGTGLFTQSGGTHLVTNLLGLGYLPGGEGSYDLSGSGSLSATSEYIGFWGTGAMTQSGGTNAVTDELILGYALTTVGSYELNAGSLSAPTQYIGRGGTGSFTHSGGTNDASSLYLGFYTSIEPNYGPSDGSYALSGSGSLSATSEYIGYASTGSFTQSGGTNSVAGNLYVGNNAGAVGSYELGAGSLSASTEYLGFEGTGSFTQSGGTNLVTNLLRLGYLSGSEGSYDLQGGILSAASVELERGSFRQSGGTLDAALFTQNGGTVSGTLQNQGTFDYSGGTFAGRLLNQGIANLGSSFTAGNGMENQSSHALGSGETLTLNGAGLDNQGDLTIDGLLQGDGLLSSYAQLDGSGEIGGSGGFANYGLFAPGSGFVISNSGANANHGNLDLAAGGQLRLTGSALSNNGTLDLNGGTVLGTGSLSNGYGGTVAGRGSILTTFGNDGGVLLVENGTTNVSQGFANSGLVQLTDFSANLTGGELSNSGSVEGHGHVGNDIVNTGIVEAIGGTLTLSGSVSNQAGGLLAASAGDKLLISSGLASNGGVVNLSGGTFDNNGHALTNDGQISGHGILRTGGLTNAGSITLTGGATTVNGEVENQSGQQIEVAQDSALFTGDVTNYGTFKTTQATVTFAGSYIEHGAFVSDPSDNYFTDLILEDSGYLVGGAGDRFFVSGDFLSSSEASMLWETANAELIFQSGGSHALAYTGADLGESYAGYTDNYAWGTLELGAGQSLVLQDGDLIAGGAIYVGVLALGGGVDEIPDSIFGNGISIYYDPLLEENAYLAGQTFELAGGGTIAPVPEPGTALLLALGLAGLFLLGSHRRAERAVAKS